MSAPFPHRSKQEKLDRPGVGALRKLAWGLIYALVIALATIVVIGPSDLAWSGGYMLRTSSSRPLVGDHLQTTYHLWLWWDALATRTHPPWLDPYQFALTGHHVYQPFGWPLVLLSLPVQALAGHIAAFNAVMVGAFIAAGGCTFLLVREFGLSRAAAAIAGFAFAFAPLRLAQADHINSLVAFLLPLILFLMERTFRREANASVWAWGFVFAYLSLVMSGEMYLVYYGTPLFVVFAVVRSKGIIHRQLRSLVAPTLTLVGGCAVLVGLMYISMVRGSTDRSPIRSALVYGPRPIDLLGGTGAGERYAYPGLVVFLLAILGLVCTTRSNAYRRLGLMLVTVVVSAYALALAPGWSPSFRAYRLIPFIELFRVPGRVLVLAALCLAVLAAFALTVIRRPRVRTAVAAVILVALTLDSGSKELFSRTLVGGDVLAAVPKGAPVLDLPPFRPRSQGGSRYMLDIITNPGPRVGGYHPFVAQELYDAQAPSVLLEQTPPSACDWAAAFRSFGFRFVTLHLDLFREPLHGQQLVEGLDRTAGFTRVDRVGAVVVYELRAENLDCVT